MTLIIGHSPHEPRIDLGRLLHELYEQAGYYDLRLDYRAEPEPPFADGDAAWIDDLLRRIY
ncbi:MAG: DUF4058 family protein [Anaerolineae bacterium]|nr:DUF4058 family protein [Anaerolineae bacterium]